MPIGREYHSLSSTANLNIGATGCFGIGMPGGFEVGMGGGFYRNTHYPPDTQLLATETVLKQAEMIARELTA